MLDFERQARGNAQLQRPGAAKRGRPGRGAQFLADNGRPARLQTGQEPAASGDHRRRQARDRAAQSAEPGPALAPGGHAGYCRIFRILINSAHVDATRILTRTLPPSRISGAVARPGRALGVVRPPSPRSPLARAAGAGPRPVSGRAEREHAAADHRGWPSEIRLHPPPAATVGPYFDRFVARFPDIRALAAASLDEVLHLWQGLGYYARARNLHACARTVAERHGGQFPVDPAQLRALPGIGDYTAAAIAAIAFDHRAAAVDGN